MSDTEAVAAVPEAEEGVAPEDNEDSVPEEQLVMTHPLGARPELLSTDCGTEEEETQESQRCRQGRCCRGGG